jgi:hypothetical protein
MENSELEKNISNKQEAIRSDAFLAKRNYDTEKDRFDGYDAADFDEEGIPEVKELQHEVKLLLSLMEASKFDDIVHLIANPSKLMAMNFIVGMVRGFGFSLALLVIFIIVMVSLADTPLFALLQ